EPGLTKRDLGRQLLKGRPQHAIERRVGVDDVAERGDWRFRLDRQYELTENLPRARAHQGRANEHFFLAVADQLQRAAVKVVDVAARGLRGVHRGDRDVDAPLDGGRLRQTDGRDLGVGVRDAWHRAVIRTSVLASQAAGDDLAVVVGEVGEATQ